MSQHDTCLSMLKSAGSAGVTTQQFLQAYIPRFSARLLELKQEGYDIQTLPYKGSCKRYVLKMAPAFSERQLTSEVSQLSFI